MWGEISDKPKFAIDENGDYYVEATSFYMTGDMLFYLLHYLNSSLSKFYFSKLGTTTGVGTIRWKKFKLEELPIPKPDMLSPETLKKLMGTLNENEADKLILSIYPFTSEELSSILEVWLRKDFSGSEKTTV